MSKKFVDQLLQPLGLVEGNAGVFGPKLRRDLGFILQEGEISDDAGERRLQVMGQIDNQVIFRRSASRAARASRRARKRTWFSSYSVSPRSSGRRMGSSLGWASLAAAAPPGPGIEGAGR